MNNGTQMGFGGGLMWLFWILLIVAVIVLVRLQGNRNISSDVDKRTPLQILEERYARGEIDEREFEQRKRKLQD